MIILMIINNLIAGNILHSQKVRNVDLLYGSFYKKNYQ